MIISRTPFRISFFGGGTDYSEWYLNNGGAVLATSIDKYCHLMCRELPPFFEHKYRVVWSKIENCRLKEEITHPAVRAVLDFLQYNDGVEIHHMGDLPARSGVGSSSAFVIGLLNALHAIKSNGLKGHSLDKSDLVRESIEIEQRHLREICGVQDQITIAHGGFNQIRFHTDGRFSLYPLNLSEYRQQELESQLMLFYTGINRDAYGVGRKYLEASITRKESLAAIQSQVDQAIEILLDGKSLSRFGSLMQEAWFLKRRLGGGITNSQIDALYDRAIEAGALGGKLLGAGGGGFMLFFVPTEKKQNVLKSLGSLLHVPFKFETQGAHYNFLHSEEDFGDRLASQWKSQSVSLEN